MEIYYDDTRKDLPCEQLYRLFQAAGWTGEENAEETEEDRFLRQHFNAPFLRSTLVISAWAGERLVGAVRVLSDEVIRSVVYDLVVDPDFQSSGIGKTLLRRCVAHYPDTEWLVATTPDLAGYYEKLGFQRSPDVFLHIPSKYAPC